MQRDSCLLKLEATVGDFAGRAVPTDVGADLAARFTVADSHAAFDGWLLRSATSTTSTKSTSGTLSCDPMSETWEPGVGQARVREVTHEREPSAFAVLTETASPEGARVRFCESSI